MARGSGSRVPRSRWIAPVLAFGILVTAAHVWLNTNVLASKDVCGGLVSTAAAEAVFPATGRISDRAGPDYRPGDALGFKCTVWSSSVLPGSADEHLLIWGSRERGDFAFTGGRWRSPATVSFFSGGVTGAVGDGQGWILLPASCTRSLPAIIEGHAPERSDPVALARLLTDVANRAAVRAGCAGDRPMAAPRTLSATPTQRAVADGTLCGVSGLVFPGADGGNGKARETAQEHTGPTWACEVEGHATYAVTQEPQILAAIAASPGYAEQPRPAGRRVSGFDTRHVVTDCAGTPTYFSMELGRSYTSALGTPGTPPPDELFRSFIDLVGKRYGCSAGTP
ncbi:hypothetical protein [Streptomyces sp. NRRL S-237]|uniref:hypothetical protein n=1 Tax=Streptomyces sp. NRRL S-237 TaxID=1463895 RepID=UPI0004CB9728|nr:hypothetical protein [Streptomyces sp. NRRL S-237]